MEGDKELRLLDECARMYGAGMFLARFCCRRGAGSVTSLKNFSVFFNFLLLDEVLDRRP